MVGFPSRASRERTNENPHYNRDMEDRPNPLIQDVHERGVAVREDLVHRHGGRELRRVERLGLLHGIYMRRAHILSLSTKGRALVGVRNNKTLSPGTILDQLAARAVIQAHEADGWTYLGPYAEHIYRLRRDGDQDRYALIKRSDYGRKHLDRLVLHHFRAIYANNATLHVYKRGPNPKTPASHRYRITVASFDPILDRAHPKVRALLEEVPA